MGELRALRGFRYRACYMPVARYGSWRSAISAATVAEGGVRLGQVAFSDGDIYWSEERASEGGRSVIVRDGTDLTPEGFNARTQVHEYGGGSWWVHGRTLFFTNWTDQRLYRQDDGGQPVAITPEPDGPRALRYADGVVTPDGRFVICVRERHVAGREAINEIVVLPADGSDQPVAVVTGNDFYSFPRLSPDGDHIAWTEWSHPNLPWDGTSLFRADVSPEGSVSNVEEIAGGHDESIFQPQWSPDGVLHFVSDRTGWWNLYRSVSGAVETIAPMEAEFGVPQWVFARSTYAFLPGGEIVCCYERDATCNLAVIHDGELEDLELPFTSMDYLTAARNQVLFVGASPTAFPAVISLDPASRAYDVVKSSRTQAPDERFISVPVAISFPSEGRTSHAFYYAPRNADFEGPSDERPPLLVLSHGGPTSNVHNTLDLTRQFWTSRGFAVVDVNYGGSTGYGREYRRLLNGQWGVVDMEDCVNAARYLAERGDVDPDRMAIRGGSAGGYTTLCALVFTDVFGAGANYFGVAEMETFVGDTHKFEARYLDSLVGPYPDEKDLYYVRSPANFADRISCPVITFQGLEDEVVPPSQSEAIVDALRHKNIPCAYITYEGEQHGFRRAENIIHSLESELYFYGRVFGFEPADELAPVNIENL